MASPGFHTFHDVVKRSRTAGDPVPGLFWIAQAAFHSNMEERMANEAVESLLEIVREKGIDCFALHDVKDIMKAAQALEIPAFRFPLDRPIEARIGLTEVIPMRLVPAAWSVVGTMCYFEKNHALRTLLYGSLDAPLDRLPGFQDALSMPITQAFVPPRGLAEPMGQWIPALKDSEGRTHDLMDLSIAGMSVDGFTIASKAIHTHADATPHEKAGYLGRQAAHAYDVSVGDILPLRHVLQVARLNKPSKRKVAGAEEPLLLPHAASELIERTEIRCESSRMVGVALQHGASISQSAWSGPGPNERPFCQTLGPLRELVYTLACVSGLSDAERAKTLLRMHQEGHDVVVLHRDHAQENQLERRHILPLHLWAGTHQVQTVATLLQVGADTKARVHEQGKYPLKGKMVLEVIQPTLGRAEEIAAMIRSAEARQSAMDAISSMGLDGFCVPKPLR